MFRQQAEAAIVDRIQSAEGWDPKIRVLAFPDKPTEIGRSQMSQAVYVRYAGTNLSRVEGNRGPYVQRGTMDFEVRLLVKNLRSHVGVYELIELIHSRLTGFRPSSIGGYSFHLPGAYLLKDALVVRDTDSNQWDWGAMFQFGLTYEGNYELE